MDADLDTLVTALYVTTDDFLIDNPQHRPWRPKVGITPCLDDTELVTLVVLQALLGFTSEARWLRYANSRLRGLFPYLPTQSGYNKRVRAAAGMLRAVIAHLVSCTSRCTDDVWVVDSTPVECGRSRETTKRSDLAGVGRIRVLRLAFALLLGTASASVCALSGLPVAFALTGAKADERDILLGMLDADPNLLATHPAQTLMADKNYYGRQFETALADAGIDLLRPARKGENPVRDNASSSHCGRSSNRSTTPSRPSSTSNATEDAPSPESPHVSCNASLPSPPPSGTTTEPTSRSCDH